MKAKFDSTEIFEVLAVINFSALLVLFILMLSGVKIALVVCFVILIIPLIFLVKLQKGVISANKNKIIIYHTFADCRIFISKINMRDIESALCTVKTFGDRWGGVSYTLKLTIVKKNGRKVVLSKAIKCQREFNVRRLEKLIDKQPLQILCDFINEQIGTRV